MGLKEFGAVDTESHRIGGGKAHYLAARAFLGGQRPAAGVLQVIGFQAAAGRRRMGGAKRPVRIERAFSESRVLLLRYRGPLRVQATAFCINVTEVALCLGWRWGSKWIVVANMA
jgi:hypothetical protein